jgi:hypothetical protein
MLSPEHIIDTHSHLADALLSLGKAVATAQGVELAEIVEIARLLTAAQQKLHTTSRQSDGRAEAARWASGR